LSSPSAAETDTTNRFAAVVHGITPPAVSKNRRKPSSGSHSHKS
jgi:hypothetical protein